MQNARFITELEEVRPRLWALPLAMPQQNLPYALTYLVQGDDEAVHVIDLGWDSDENWATFTAALQSIGSSLDQVATATVTHMHHDHVGLAARLRAASPAQIALSRVEQAAIDSPVVEVSDEAQNDIFRAWGVPVERWNELGRTFTPTAGRVKLSGDRALDEGDVLPIAGREIEVLATPGHTTGSITLVDRENGLLFTGDHLLPTIFAGLGLGGPSAQNPIDAYLDSLAKLEPFDDFLLLPGHGYALAGLRERRLQSAEHHLRRSREAATVLAEHPGSTTWQVASRLTWTAGWQNLAGPYLHSALAQTAMHIDRVTRSAGPPTA